MRDRDAHSRGYGHGARHAGHDLDLDSGLPTGECFLAAAAENVRIAALEPHDTATSLRVLDEQLVDLVLRHRVVAGCLANVDDLDVRVELVEQATRAESVGDDDVGLGEQLPSARGDQCRRAWTTSDESNMATSSAVPPNRQGAGVERGLYGGAQRRRTLGVTAGAHRYRHVTDTRHCRGPGRRLRGIVSAYAPHPLFLGIRGDLGVDVSVAGRRVREPRTVEIARRIVAVQPPRTAVKNEVQRVLAHVGRDDDHFSSGCRQGSRPSRRDRPAAHDDAAPTRNVEQ